MKSSLPSVNLLNFDRKNIGMQFVDWALTVGRLLVIITETIAFCMFAYRFIIDKQLVDLHDNIKKYEPSLSAAASPEATYRDLQDRLQTIKIHSVGTTQFQNVVTALVGDARGLVIFQDLKLGSSKVSLSASSPSVAGMRTFIEKLRADPTTKTLSVDQVSTDGTGSVVFSLSIVRTNSL